MTGICIGIDIGTCNFTAYVEGRGIVSHAPNVACIDAHSGKILALGDRAYEMIGRAPASMKVVRPFTEGVVSDIGVTAEILKSFVERACRFSVLRPNIIAGVPSDMTELERKAVLDVLDMSGAARLCVMEHTYAAAVGAQLEFSKPGGTMIIDVGGGTADIAVVSAGAVAAYKTVRSSGDALTYDIIRYLRRERDIEVGYLTAEYIKKTVGGASVRREEIALVSKGRNTVTGAPINFEITSTEVYWALKEHIDLLLGGVKELFSTLSPELCSDVYESGIVLTGAGARLYGLDAFLEGATGIPVSVAKEPHLCVAKGLGKSFHSLKTLRKNGYDFKYREEL